MDLYQSGGTSASPTLYLAAQPPSLLARALSPVILNTLGTLASRTKLPSLRSLLPQEQNIRHCVVRGGCGKVAASAIGKTFRQE